MKYLVNFALLIFTFYPCFSQVNRYSSPPAVAQYNPMSFDELLFAPKIKSKKYDENLQNLKSIYSDILAYVEVYKEDFDEQFEKEILAFSAKFDQLAKSDLSSKEFEIQKLGYEFKKIQRDFENRLKFNTNPKESSGTTSSISKKNSGSDAPTKVELGVPVYSLPRLKRDYPESEIIGYTKRYNFVLLEKHNEEFYKIKLDGKLGFISIAWVNKEWRD